MYNNNYDLLKRNILVNILFMFVLKRIYLEVIGNQFKMRL